MSSRYWFSKWHSARSIKVPGVRMWLWKCGSHWVATDSEPVASSHHTYSVLPITLGSSRGSVTVPAKSVVESALRRALLPYDLVCETYTVLCDSACIILSANVIAYAAIDLMRFLILSSLVKWPDLHTPLCMGFSLSSERRSRLNCANYFAHGCNSL